MDQRVHMQRKLKQICGGLEKSIVQIKNVYKDKVLHVRREAGWAILFQVEKPWKTVGRTELTSVALGEDEERIGVKGLSNPGLARCLRKLF